MIFMTGVTADGSSTFTPSNTDTSQRVLFISGTLDGTIKVQAQDPQDSSWLDMEGLAYTAVGAYAVTLPQLITYRINLSGETSSDVNVTLV
jgi:hypothetical protein